MMLFAEEQRLRFGGEKRIVLKTVPYGSPVQVRCMGQGARGLVHWDEPEEWDGEGGGRGVQDGEHMYTCD